MKTIQVNSQLQWEKRSNIIAHFCTWPGVKFGKPDVYTVRTEWSFPSVTPVTSNGPVLRLSEETQANRSKKVEQKRHKADYLKLEK